MITTNNEKKLLYKVRKLQGTQNKEKDKPNGLDIKAQGNTYLLELTCRM